MSDENIVSTDLSEDEILEFTQRKRKELIDHMVKDGLPSKARDQEVFLTALADMDRTVHTNKKIGVSEKQLGAGLLVAKALEDISAHYGNKNPFEMNHGDPLDTLPQDFNDDKLPELEDVPGETDIGISSEKFETFIPKFEN